MLCFVVSEYAELVSLVHSALSQVSCLEFAATTPDRDRVAAAPVQQRPSCQIPTMCCQVTGSAENSMQCRWCEHRRAQQGMMARGGTSAAVCEVSAAAAASYMYIYIYIYIHMYMYMCILREILHAAAAAAATTYKCTYTYTKRVVRHARQLAQGGGPPPTREPSSQLHPCWTMV